MALTKEHQTILTYLYENRNELPVDANLNTHCSRMMSDENRHNETFSLIKLGLVGSQTGFSGFFILKPGVAALEAHWAEEAALKRKKTTRTILIAIGVAAAIAIAIALLK